MIKKYLPMLLVELYLITTLVLFYFGPVSFKLHNELLFILLIFLYHLSFVVGYFVAVKTFTVKKITCNNTLSSSLYYLTLFFGIFSILVSYKNLMFGESLIPFNLVSDVTRGLTNPGAVYAERMTQVDQSGGSRVLNIFSFLFSFSKFLFLFVIVYYWGQLSLFRRILAILFIFLFPLPGLVSGTNSIVFYLFIFFVSSCLIISYIRRYKHLNLILLLGFLLFLIPIGLFGFMMSQRGGGFEYFASTSPLGDVSVLMDTPDSSNLWGYYQYSLVWLNYYLVQGYYGFSLILNIDWDWTFGFGNSAFAQRQFMMISGIDVSSSTFQYKISDAWDKDAQWHSFYGQMANDFGLVGLAFFMAIWGFFLSRVWLSAMYHGSFFGAALLPIFVMWMVFIPANNQVFGFIDTVSFLVIVTIFWFLEHKKVRI